MFRVQLKKLREDAKLSQAAFAKKIGTTQSTVGGWEAGVKMPRYETMEKIADLFGVSVDYLLGREEVPVALSRVNGYENLTDEEKEQIDALIELFGRKNN